METTTEDAPAVDDRPLIRAVRLSRLVALGFVICSLALVAAGALRFSETQHIRSGGTRLNALVADVTRGVFERAVLVRYDVDDGRILTTGIPVTRTPRLKTGDAIRVAYDPARPGRVRALGYGDPGLRVYAGSAVVLLFAGILIAWLSGRFRKRAWASEDSSDIASMHATMWRSRSTLFARLDIPAVPDAPAWWVRLLPGQDISPIVSGATVTVRGALGDRAPVVLEADGVVLWTSGKPGTKRPTKAQEMSDGASSRRPSTAIVTPALLAATLFAAPFAIDGPLLRIGAQPPAACREVDHVLGGRSSLRDRAAPATIDQTSVLGLPKLLLSSPPKGIGFDRATNAVDTFMTLSSAAATRRDIEEGERVLRRYGYVGGYRRDWTAGGRLLAVFAYEFSSARNAAAFDAYANRYVCPLDSEVFAPPVVPGAVGSRILTARGTELQQISFVRGTRRYLVGITFGTPVATHGEVERLAEAEARIAG